MGARRYKKIDGLKLAQYEDAYQRYLNEKLVSETPPSPIVHIDDKTEVSVVRRLI